MKIDAVKNGQSCPLEEKVFTAPFVLCKLDFFLFPPKFPENQRYKSVDLWTDAGKARLRFLFVAKDDLPENVVCLARVGQAWLNPI